MAYVETPRTDAGNATYMSNAHNLEGFSVENSFLSPSKSQGDLISQLRNGRGHSLKTPRSRVPFTDRQNQPKPSLRGEFTPLLKSAARNSILQKGKLSGVGQIPMFPKAGYEEINSPALPAAEFSGFYNDTASSVGVDGDDTPVPQIASSSAQSTPLAVLPKREAGGVLADQGNVMTLREQENNIKRIGNENFGLKLKIHFLEENLRKAGPGFNEAALKENTDLKVDRVTLQKELSRARKTLSHAERELETYRRHLQEVQEDVKRKHIDEGIRIELESLRDDVAAKNSEVNDLKERLESAEVDEEELERAKENAEGLEAEIRARDRLIEERDVEIERLQAREKNDSDNIDEGIRIELETLRDDVAAKNSEVDDLKERLESAEVDEEELERAKDNAEALEAEIQERDRLIEERDEEIERLQVREKNDSEKMAELHEELNKVLENGQRAEAEIQRALEDSESQHAADRDQWASQRRNLLSQKEKADEQAAGLQRTISKLQEAEGTLSGREMKLKEALESEKQRFQSEEDVLSRQIQDLHADVESKRSILDGLRAELSNTKEELRTCQRDQSIWGEKVQELEDELDVLQAERDDEAERATEAINAATSIQEQLDIAKKELVREKTMHAYAQVQDSSNKQLTAEHELEGEIKRASDEEARLNNEIDDLRHKVAAASEGRDRELLAARQKVQRLEIQISELQSRLAHVEQEDNAIAEPSFLQEELNAARAKEAEFLEREAAHKNSIRDLKRNVARLERQLHEVEIARLAADSPQPSVLGSGRKEEIAELRRQLADAHHQTKDSRTKSKESERELQRKLAELNQQAQSDQDARERERDQWELELSSCRMQHDQQLAKSAAAEQNLARLRIRVQNLEKDLQVHRQTAAGDLTMADERKDLHEMLKDAKLTAESLQVEISSRETLLTASSSREKELRAHIRRIREERNVELEKSTALSSELEHLQGRYERAVDNFTRQQKTWEEERKKLTSGVRFVNTSLSSVHDGDATAELKKMDQMIWEKEKRHESELLGLANQIHWLKAMGRREERFRHSLVHGKQYLLEEIEIRDRYTKASLTLLAKMGIASPYPPPPLRPGATELERSKHILDSMKDPASKRPSLRAVGLMLMAGSEMKRLAGKWAAVKRSNAEAGRSHIAEKARTISDNAKGTPDRGRSIAEKARSISDNAKGTPDKGRSIADGKGKKKESFWDGAVGRRQSFGKE
ncbi:hypothetical protein MMC07_003815 [Pseudocyphellaria aurata]|nr:hypothetical protein [Pseudocyphellaria aurata]